jgi:hypothetical protein
MAKRASPTDVTVDLTENDVENGEIEGGNSSLESLRKHLSIIPVALPASKRVKLFPIVAGKTGESATTTDASEPSVKTASEDDQDDVEVIEASRFVPTSVTATGTSDEIEVVATVNQVLLPHMRQHCIEKLFIPYGTATMVTKRYDNNMKVCSLCYCYVCDVEVSKCPSWGSHCSASDSGPNSAHWTEQREHHKQSTRNTAGEELQTNGDEFCASGQLDLTKCRKCGLFNKFGHKNFELDRDVASGLETEETVPYWYRENWHGDEGYTDDIHPTGYLDWCHSCGRVASDRDFRKVQSQRFVPSPHSIYLGYKEIMFRLKAHDPREMDQYRNIWEEQQWTYDETEMEQELFDHRLGNFPLLEMIVASMPITTEDKIPTEGRHYTEYQTGDDAKASLSETEAVLIDDDGESLILKELFKTSPLFGGAAETDKPTQTQYIDGDITAMWDRSTHRGVSTFLAGCYTICQRSLNSLSFRFFLTQKFRLSVFVNRKAPGLTSLSPPLILTAPAYLTQFLGTWFNVLPFPLADVCGLLRPDGEPFDKSCFYDWRGKLDVPLPPFTLIDKDTPQDFVDAASKEKAEIEKRQNEIVDQRTGAHALESGTGCSLLGGLCTDETDFAGSLKRYFREILPDVVSDASRSDLSLELGLVRSELGLVSRHRSMRQDQKWVVPFGCGNWTTTREESTHKYDSFLSSTEYAFAITNMKRDANLIHDKTTNLHGLMDHLENLGHTAAPFVEGLTVELLPFQSQTVQWATEREQTPGGINAFLWTKLPSVAQPNTDLYFSPILEELTATKPKLARGGIIAEQMGLGKTVISLAMILRNPAPPLPASGTAVSSINVTPAISSGAAFWDPDLYSRTSASKKKRGSIISRGTLVVVSCWIKLTAV